MFEGHVVPTAPYNLFRGRIINEGRVFDTGSIQFDISGTTGQGSTLLIDPCKISFSTRQEFDNLPNVFYGKMVSISLFRNVVRIEALVGEKFEIHTSVSPETSRLCIGEEIHVYVSPDAMTIV